MPWYKSYDMEPLELKSKKFPAFLTYSILILPLLLGGLFLYMQFNYLDLANLCLIKIDHDVLRGNRSTITKALRRLKDRDFSTYNDVCLYVRKIYEDTCYLGRENVPDLNRVRSPGCYIAGSKAIVVPPMKEDDLSSVAEQMGNIKTYAAFAKEFWVKQYTK